MAVTSRDYSASSEARGISRRSLRRSRTTVERALAWLVLLLGYAGSLIASQGGWSNVAALRWQLAPAVAVAILQGILTWLQWSYDDRPWVARPARAIDAGLTLAGWGPLLIGLATAAAASFFGILIGIAAMFGGALTFSPQTALIGGWIVLSVAAIGAAWYPEHTLVNG